VYRLLRTYITCPVYKITSHDIPRVWQVTQQEVSIKIFKAITCKEKRKKKCARSHAQTYDMNTSSKNMIASTCITTTYGNYIQNITSGATSVIYSAITSVIYTLYTYCNHNHNGINVCMHTNIKVCRFIIRGVNVQYISFDPIQTPDWKHCKIPLPSMAAILLSKFQNNKVVYLWSCSSICLP
jgi:hypothetical protein